MLALCVQLQPVRAESKRIAIVFSPETATHWTDAQLLLGYDALMMPLMSHVATAQLLAIEQVLGMRIINKSHSLLYRTRL
jgi:hypothetical protein